MSVTLNINLLSLLSVGFDYLVEDALTCLVDYGFPSTSLSGYHNQPNYCTPCPLLSRLFGLNPFETTESSEPFQPDQFP